MAVSLQKALQYELGGDPMIGALPQTLLESQVVEVLLSTGAPCSSHAGAFANWPGEESDVTRWFRLANGSAVGIRSQDGEPIALAQWDQQQHA